MNPLLQLSEFGQSYWLDNLTRALIKSGELKRRVQKEDLRGVTSNPSIFNKAISRSNDYQEQIESLIDQGHSVPEIYEGLVVQDIRSACDVLKPVYRRTNGVDGFVSLEVSPYLAYDTEGTLDEARRLHKAVRRSNLYIKIPGTEAGVPAIEEALYEGININITLLFSIRNYEAVARAYIKALERRLAEGKPVDNVISVASFFLSRIDVLVDQLLSHRIDPDLTGGRKTRPEQLLGKAAIANAKLAYQSYKKLFGSRRWKKLQEKGARVQRVLWASTSTKNPLYEDVRYIEPLIGPDTVNTLPDETIKAFSDHGTAVPNSIEEDLDDARRTMSDLAKVGIDLDQVTTQLEAEGVQKFIDPYDQLMSTLAATRREYLAKKQNRYNLDLKEVKSTIATLNSLQFGRRLFGKDPLIWANGRKTIEKIHNRLGWLDVPEGFQDRAEEIKEFARQVKRDGFKDVVVLGMGGSSLCPEVAAAVFGSAKGWPLLHVLDSTSPEAVLALENTIRLKETLFLVSSKSGTTLETLSFFKYFYQRVSQTRIRKPGQRFAAITDPGSPLEKLARENDFRHCFANPPDIGGRYSALSYFGLVPMALLGLDPTALLEQASQAMRDSGPFIPAGSNPAVDLGIFLGSHARDGRNKVAFFISEPLAPFGHWVEQLLAESTGKDGKGLIPVIGEYSNGSAGLGPNSVIVDMTYTRAQEKQRLKAVQNLVDGYPAVRIEMSEKLGLVEEFVRWEIATATAGAILGVNPFDEPNVAESKENTSRLLKEWTEKGVFQTGQPLSENSSLAIFSERNRKWLWQKQTADPSTVLRRFLEMADETGYVAVLPYCRQTRDRDQLLASMQEKIRKQRGAATTLGYGPRYLHSTGQLHKGGPNSGLFLMITHDPAPDVEIPDYAFSFGTLLLAQALGDLRALQKKQRRALRVHLKGDVDKGLKKLVSVLE